MNFKNTLERTKLSDEKNFVARYGGEEFCALLIDYAGKEDTLKHRMERVRTAVETLEIPLGVPARFDEGYKHRTITIAGGIKAHDETVLSLVKRVDDSLKDAKKLNRRNTVVMSVLSRKYFFSMF